jgi:AcrR family transcriptional regulator
MQDEGPSGAVGTHPNDLHSGSRPDAESLRSRRKRELRQHLSDVATELFLEQGFDAVRVSDIAKASGVTEKTVFNHFSCKEALLADRWKVQADAVRSLLSRPDISPVDAVLQTLSQELRFMLGTDTGRKGRQRLKDLQRFSQLIQSTPSLVAYHRYNLDQLTTSIATAIAQRTGALPDDPEPTITAAAVAGLWGTMFHSLHKHLALDGIADIERGMSEDLSKAAEVLRRGI